MKKTLLSIFEAILTFVAYMLGITVLILAVLLLLTGLPFLYKLSACVFAIGGTAAMLILLNQVKRSDRRERDESLR